ncbi:MAG: hypothetical protein FWD69_13930 [Polyangiaceae bacterium]|nr:hypothetical protein [Polyangiaceae bacterium]
MDQSTSTIWSTLSPGIGIVVVILVLVSAKWRMAAWDKETAKFRLFEVAQRTRLSIAQGDPNLNLVTAYSTDNWKAFTRKKGFWAALSGDASRETRALLRGAPNGHPTEFSYYLRTDRTTGMTFSGRSTREYKHTSDCRLTIWVSQPFAPFEVVLRNPPQYMECLPPTMSLPPVSLGDPVLDAKFALSTTDPRVAPVLAQTLAPLMNVTVFHLRASDQSISFVMSAMECSCGIYFIEQVQYAMEQMASLFEGHSAPGAIAS